MYLLSYIGNILICSGKQIIDPLFHANVEIIPELLQPIMAYYQQRQLFHGRSNG